jgi:hypothetical protein
MGTFASSTRAEKTTRLPPTAFTWCTYHTLLGRRYWRPHGHSAYLTCGSEAACYTVGAWPRECALWVQCACLLPHHAHTPPNTCPEGGCQGVFMLGRITLQDCA